MILGYNTNGLAHHDPLSALEMLAETGYRCVSITIDHSWMSPFSKDAGEQRQAIAKKLNELGLSSVIETGARYLLDPRRKHWPSLVAAPDEAAPRVQLIEYACDVARELNSSCVSIWSGAKPSDWDLQKGWDALAMNLERVLKTAERFQMPIAFEPEPGMFVDTMASFDRLRNWVDHPLLKLTMDVGHLFCQGELPIVDYIHRFSSRLVNVHMEDMNQGVHEHLMFGHGSMNFLPIIDAFAAAKYTGPISVELSRHSHDAPRVVKEAFEFLKPMIEEAQRKRKLL